MKKYIVFGYTDIKTFNKSKEPSQEERQEIMKKWMSWKDEMGDKLVSMGSPLINGTLISKDGILNGDTSNLSGYMIIKAEDQIEAHMLLSISPLFGQGHAQKYELFECIM